MFGDFGSDSSFVNYSDDSFLLTPIRKSFEEVELGDFFEEGDGSRECPTSLVPIKKVIELFMCFKIASEGDPVNCTP